MMSRPFLISFNQLHWLPFYVYSYIKEELEGCKKISMFIKTDGATDGLDNWLVLDTIVDVSNKDDPFIQAMITRIKHATGYFEAEKILEQEGFSNDFNIDQLKKIIRSSLSPSLSTNPNFPERLEVRRNEFGELMAQEVLEQNTDIKFPLSTHSMIENPDTTKKGLDGFGLIDLNGDKKLVVLEAKTSEDKKSPPSVAKSLMDDCRNVLSKKGTAKLIRTLFSLLLQYKQDPEKSKMILKWIESIGVKPADAIHHICPVIIRGCITSKVSDLKGFMGGNQDYSPNGSIGVSCSTNQIKIIDLCNKAYEQVEFDNE